MSKIIDIKGNETKSPSKPLYNYATFLREKHNKNLIIR